MGIYPTTKITDQMNSVRIEAGDKVRVLRTALPDNSAHARKIGKKGVVTVPVTEHGFTIVKFRWGLELAFRSDELEYVR